MKDENMRLECIKLALTKKDIKIYGFGELQKNIKDYDNIPYPTIVAEHIRHYVETGETKYGNSFLTFLEGQILVDERYCTGMEDRIKQLSDENMTLKEKKTGCLICRLLSRLW